MLGEGGGGGEEGQARTGDAQGPCCACPGAHQTRAACRGDSEEAEENDRFLPKNTPVKTARDETERKKVTRKKKQDTKQKKEKKTGTTPKK